MARISRTYLPIQATKSFFMDSCHPAPLILPKMQDKISLTLCWHSVDALLTLIFRMWVGAVVCFFCTSRRLICPTWTVTYQCQYFTINCRISECNCKLESQYAEPEIGTEGLDKHGQSRRLTGTCLVLVRQQWAGRLCGWSGTEPTCCCGPIPDRLRVPWTRC